MGCLPAGARRYAFPVTSPRDNLRPIWDARSLAPEDKAARMAWDAQGAPPAEVAFGPLTEWDALRQRALELLFVADGLLQRRRRLAALPEAQGALRAAMVTGDVATLRAALEHLDRAVHSLPPDDPPPAVAMRLARPASD